MTTQTVEQDMSAVREIVDRCKDIKGNLITILHQVQNHYGYVPKDAIKEISVLLSVPTAKIYEVLTFYNFFKLKPAGKHTVSVCMGTACYLKGGDTVKENFKNRLKIEEGETTEDGLFNLEIVRCVGCCGLAPTVVVDEKVYSVAKKRDVDQIIDKYSAE